MRVLFVAAEASPLVKVGGLADVVGSLPRALNDLGHEVRILIPAYSCLSINSHRTQDILSLTLHLPGGASSLTLQQLVLGADHHFYLIRDSGFLSGPHVYTDNDLGRFLFFSRAVFELLPRLDWQPEIVHCHDWHTALIPMWLKHSDSPYASVFTIHNLAYQGTASWDFLTVNRLEHFWKDLPPGLSYLPTNFLAQGILCGDMVTTVSRTYAREIVTPALGMGLDGILRYRQDDLIGIVNGIDPDEFDPATDHHLAFRYDRDRLEGKLKNKLALQRRSNLPQDIEVPVVGMVSRLDEQKGFDILVPALGRLANRNVQFVLLGQGRGWYEAALKEAAARHPDRIAVYIGFAEDLAPLIYAGSDIFLMPSRFEPCGLSQMIAMRYGAVPVVRRTGGLADTVPDVNVDFTEGHGFVFDDYHPDALIAAIDRALTAYQNRGVWNGLVKRIMGLDFSWRVPAREYEMVYKKAMEARLHARK
ncbi:MAG: glycogen synthase GlgA [Dehalococcoidia bacterium]|nr:glycogen synthase GlgA [Dehalococcoidia bacterium]